MERFQLTGTSSLKGELDLKLTRMPSGAATARIRRYRDAGRAASGSVGVAADPGEPEPVVRFQFFEVEAVVYGTYPGPRSTFPGSAPVIFP